MNGGPGEDAGVAEDVHQQSVGADGAVELAAGAVAVRVMTVGDAAGGAVALGEARGPCGVGEDGAPRGRVEIAVQAFAAFLSGECIGLEDDAGQASVGDFVRMDAGVPQGAVGEFAAEGG